MQVLSRLPYQFGLCRFLQPENAYDAFALFARTVHTELARFYGASFADILNVAAFTCVRKLGASVGIPEACDAAGIPLYVRIPCSAVLAWQTVPILHAH